MQAISHITRPTDFLFAHSAIKSPVTNSFQNQLSAAEKKQETVWNPRDIIRSHSMVDAIRKLGFNVYIEELRKEDLRALLKAQLLEELGLTEKKLAKLGDRASRLELDELNKRIEEEVEKRLKEILLAEKRLGRHARYPSDEILTDNQREEKVARKESLLQLVELLESLSG